MSPITFSTVVEAIKTLSTDEKQEIQFLLNHYICEDRRDEILNNFNLAQTEAQNGTLNFSSDVDELKRLIEDY